MNEDMRREYRRKCRKAVYRRTVVLAVAVVLLLGAVVSGTVAWLTAKSTKVNNVFTASNISLELTESKTDFKMIPGYEIEKDPVITVGADSEPCRIFIKVEEKCGIMKNATEYYSFDDFVSYSIDSANYGFTR